MSNDKNLFEYVDNVTMSQEILKFIRHVDKKSKNSLKSLTRLIEYTLKRLIGYYEKGGKPLKLMKLRFAHKFLHTDSSLKNDFIKELIDIYTVSILSTLKEIELSFLYFHKNRYYERLSLSHTFQFNIELIRKELEIVIQYSSGICITIGQHSTLTIKRNHNHSGYAITGLVGDTLVFLQRFSAEERETAVDLFIKELEFALYYVYEIRHINDYYHERMEKVKISKSIYRQLNMNNVKLPQQTDQEVIPSYRRNMKR